MLVQPSNQSSILNQRGAHSPSFLSPVILCLLLLFIGYTAPFSLLAEVSFTSEFLDKIQKDYGDYPRRRLVSWQQLIEANKNIDEKKKLEVVNNYFNLLEFQSDQIHWGEEDYWATPLEFIVSGAGDCEDFSIAKYFTLRELGVPDEKMMITYVKAVELNQAHMVLTYYATPTSEPLVLDNLMGDILPAGQRSDLVPVYSFNGAGLWQAKQRGLGKKIGDSDDLDNWSDMEKRMSKGTIKKFR